MRFDTDPPPLPPSTCDMCIIEVEGEHWCDLVGSPAGEEPPVAEMVQPAD